jgi:hypothetical protein
MSLILAGALADLRALLFVLTGSSAARRILAGMSALNRSQTTDALRSWGKRSHRHYAIMRLLKAN